MYVYILSSVLEIVNTWMYIQRLDFERSGAQPDVRGTACVARARRSDNTGVKQPGRAVIGLRLPDPHAESELVGGLGSSA